MNSRFEYKPLFYFSMTFFVTFAFWFAGAHVSFQEDGGGVPMTLMLPGLIAPFLISVAMVFRSGNAGIKKDFIDRMINFRRIEPKMLPVFFLIMPLAVLGSILVSLLFGGSTAQFQLAEGFSFSAGFLPVLMLLFMAAMFEELGWRGYAFDSLQARYTFFTASIVFSLLWSLWHFPLIFVNGSYQYNIRHENIWFAVNFFVSIIPMGVIVSWICIKNGKSILAAVLFHFIINISQELWQMTQMTKCIETVLLTLAAAAIIAFDKELFFSKEHLLAGIKNSGHESGAEPVMSKAILSQNSKAEPLTI